ncbi:TPA: hypothetical protein N0F65_010906 [Lagenidium giganteum]|uniref:SAC3/GANP/THP3 conserved domain-containing protein n=1 Tax=Lagenidium giganteum TaxID=4803 RepID=A0AAV2YVT0_9STRA|nr:TPA: hypothetical protein N0F65_010906 [Lagenidium giganteum]
MGLYETHARIALESGDINEFNRVQAKKALRAQEDIKHALAVREAVAMNNYHRFFMLYASAPNMAGYLMDPLVPSIRLKALRAICKAYRPQIPIDFVRQELHLKGEEGEKFINECGIVFVGGPKGERKMIDAEASDLVVSCSSE